ncbi:MAG: hypothetical protein A2Y25_08160 [Candidatus Melainabacteria bacterium GWF2_37_15]|nr:MAG: hypothetical protein A2Y25_08160 [Candidatus Melainabacteria bacterium GWF2_37_15]
MDNAYANFNLERSKRETATKKNIDLQSLTPEQAIKYLTFQLNIFTQKAHNLAFKDALTGLNNRRSYDIDRKKEFINACKEQTPLSFIFLDLDNFGAYNKAYGHDQGDEALKIYANIVKNTINTAGKGENREKVYRFGGEEIMILLPDTNYSTAGNVARQLRKNLEKDTQVLIQNKKIKNCLTASIGFSTFKPDIEMKNIEESIKKSKGNKLCCRELFKPLEDAQNNADKASRKAKKLGKNIACGEKTFVY